MRKHASKIKLWAEHEGLKVEVLCDNEWLPTEPKWHEEKEYRFAVPKDADGEEIKIGEAYLLKHEWYEVIEINQENAMLLTERDGVKFHFEFWLFKNARKYRPNPPRTKAIEKLNHLNGDIANKINEIIDWLNELSKSGTAQ